MWQTKKLKKLFKCWTSWTLSSTHYTQTQSLMFVNSAGKQISAAGAAGHRRLASSVTMCQEWLWSVCAMAKSGRPIWWKCVSECAAARQKQSVVGKVHPRPTPLTGNKKHGLHTHLNTREEQWKRRVTKVGTESRTEHEMLKASASVYIWIEEEEEEEEGEQIVCCDDSTTTPSNMY